MLSFFMKPRSQTSSKRYEAQLQDRVTRPFYKTSSPDLVRTAGSFQVERIHASRQISFLQAVHYQSCDHTEHG